MIEQEDVSWNPDAEREKRKAQEAFDSGEKQITEKPWYKDLPTPIDPKLFADPKLFDNDKAEAQHLAKTYMERLNPELLDAIKESGPPEVVDAIKNLESLAKGEYERKITASPMPPVTKPGGFAGYSLNSVTLDEALTIKAGLMPPVVGVDVPEAVEYEYTDFGGQMVRHHAKNKCEGEICCIHNPSKHQMRRYKRRWRDDRQMMERICEHGVGHPDPDDLAYRTAKWLKEGKSLSLGHSSHGCDGCCGKPVDVPQVPKQ